MLAFAVVIWHYQRMIEARARSVVVHGMLDGVLASTVGSRIPRLKDLLMSKSWVGNLGSKIDVVSTKRNGMVISDPPNSSPSHEHRDVLD